MVGDGARYMREEIIRLFGEFDSEHPQQLPRIARSFLESEIVSHARGALDLCSSTARNNMDGTERDGQRISAVKACRSVDFVLTLLGETFCTQVLNESPKGKIPEAADYYSLDVAPRSALEVLGMFGALE